VWVDDPVFDIANHVRRATCRTPGDPSALLATAAELLTAPLPGGHPLWSATLVEGMRDGGCALVLIFHHVLADGMGGLAMLASLVDDGQAPPVPQTVSRPPNHRALAIDAAVSRLRALAHIGKTPSTIRAALAELRSGSTPRAARSSLNRPVGPRRTLATVRADLAWIRSLAHAQAASVNDVVLTAVGGALDAFLARRGEHVDPLVISVPVSGRSQTAAGALGNQVGVMPVAVPATGDVKQRLDAVAVATRKHKTQIRGASAAVLAPLARALAAMHFLRWVVNHQHLVHTFTTNLRGPQSPVSFLGARVSEILPLSVLAGNVAVAFAVMSYAGRVTVTISADPEVVTELDVIVDALQQQLSLLEELSHSG
jgi:WS/DGAT/MGAT family acyltransferase